MLKQLITLSASAAIVLAFAGCQKKVTYIETGGNQSVVSVGEVDIQDIQRAASDMLDSMIANGVLRTAPHQPARVVVDRVVNDTSSRFDTGELLYRMRAQLVNSGQAQIQGAYGSNPETEVAQDEMKRKAFLEGKSGGDVFKEDFTLTGKITQLKRQAGNVRQSTYTFRLTLFNMNTGREVWTDYSEVTKQGTKNDVGF